MKPAQSKRLDALDGLRGIAILLVFFNHIDSTIIVKVFPSFLRPVISAFFSSGVIGVSLLFILSGFLMSYIYPQPANTLSFLQKRYTRIFPLFISMVLAMSVFRNFPDITIVLRILTILFIALVVHFIWVFIVQKRKSPRLGKILFIGFLIIQVIAMFWYLIVMKKPPIFFNQLIPKFLKEGTITLVNATLTLPFGNLIPMLDGVYWSLASEILFYILYPIICVPFVNTLRHQNKYIKTGFLVSLFFLFSAITMLSRHIFAFTLFFWPLFIYFAAGIALGYVYKNKEKVLNYFMSKIVLFANPIVFIILIIVVNLSLVYTTGWVNDWIRMLSSIPIILMAAFLLHKNNRLFNFFSSKLLVFLGTISYSVYLIHTSMVDGIHLIFKPTNLMNNILFIIISIILTLGMATIINYLLEKPYFTGKYKTADQPNKTYSISFPGLAIGLILILFIGVLTAYQSNFNFFSYQKTFGREIIVSPQAKNTSSISLKDNPEIRFKITSPEDKLGIVTANVQYDGPAENSITNPTEQQLVFQIKPESSTDWTTTSKYKPYEIGTNAEFPFGFPMIENAKGKVYNMRLFLTNRNSSQNVRLNIGNGVLTTVHQLNKSTLIKNPIKLMQLVLSRGEHVINNFEARLVFIQLLPFVLLTIVLVLKKRSFFALEKTALTKSKKTG